EGAAPAVRDVTPAGVLRVFRSKDNPDFLPDGARHYTNVRVGDDAILQADGARLRLYGIALPPRRKICRTATGARWTCGQRALMALRALVEGQLISCVLKDAAPVALAVCRVRNVDISGWMLREGWAELASGTSEKAYVEAQSSAQSQKAGIWSLDPPH
ncbi:MAG TPA: thermonuclease family protein, partial [Xanthobacteraceae bacterium]|nr:thermonuclease family protein [Xanthobacteraceae bacterium]